ADLASALLVFGLGALYVHLRIVRWPLLPTLGRLTFAALPFIGSLVGLRALGVNWLVAVVVSWSVYAISLRICGIITEDEILWVQQFLEQRNLAKRGMPQ
ncbi:MAG: hypothetical protein H0X37_13865, partial [Herpetosiphonaceae bacterium]|nr:hypothetical protein [Herpetosiphonaceae bacterium]